MPVMMLPLVLKFYWSAYAEMKFRLEKILKLNLLLR